MEKLKRQIDAMVQELVGSELKDNKTQLVDFAEMCNLSMVEFMQEFNKSLMNTLDPALKKGLSIVKATAPRLEIVQDDKATTATLREQTVDLLKSMDQDHSATASSREIPSLATRTRATPVETPAFPSVSGTSSHSAAGAPRGHATAAGKLSSAQATTPKDSPTYVKGNSAREQYVKSFPNGHEVLPCSNPDCTGSQNHIEEAEEMRTHTVLAMTLMKWGEGAGQVLQLGIWRPGAEPILFLNQSSSRAVNTMWVQYEHGHHSGMKPKA